ncbi:MAG: hypothetical protein ACRBCT_09095 [Alphaproteobacteria bacterium]
MNEEAYGLLLMSGLAPDPNDSAMQAEYTVCVHDAFVGEAVFSGRLKEEMRR